MTVYLTKARADEMEERRNEATAAVDEARSKLADLQLMVSSVQGDEVLDAFGEDSEVYQEWETVADTLDGADSAISGIEDDISDANGLNFEVLPELDHSAGLPINKGGA